MCVQFMSLQLDSVHLEGKDSYLCLYSRGFEEEGLDPINIC